MRPTLAATAARISKSGKSIFISEVFSFFTSSLFILMPRFLARMFFTLKTCDVQTFQTIGIDRMLLFPYLHDLISGPPRGKTGFFATVFVITTSPT